MLTRRKDQCYHRLQRSAMLTGVGQWKGDTMTKVTAILGSSVLFLSFIPFIHADVNIPGLGSGAYDVPSVGGPGDKVDKAPNCETHLRPTNTNVTSDPGNPGEKMTNKGENFQTKDCFQDVSFGARGGNRSDSKISSKYIDKFTV